MSEPEPCRKCPEGETSRISHTAICVVCKQTKDMKDIFDGVCKDCLTQHLGYTLQTLRVCSKCGKQVTYPYNRITSPCCNATIITVTRITKTPKQTETNPLRPLKKWESI